MSSVFGNVKKNSEYQPRKYKGMTLKSGRGARKAKKPARRDMRKQGAGVPRLRAGYGVADITPEGECELNGFIARKQPALGVGAPIKARVVVLDEGRVRAAVAVCDLLGLTVVDSARLEAIIAKAAGVPARNVMLACTHTHSAPMSMPLGAVGKHRPSYVSFVGKRLGEAARDAAADLAAVERVTFGSRRADAFGKLRCALEEPGRSGRFKGMLSAFRLDRADTSPITVGHLGVHPYVVGPEYRYVHPDYPGAVCDAIEAATSGHAMMLPGAAADVSPVDAFHATAEPLRVWGRRAADVVRRMLRGGERVELSPLRVSVARPRVRFGWVSPKQTAFSFDTADPRVVANIRGWRRAYERGRLPESSPFPIRVLRLGDIALIGMPAEIFFDTGAEIAAALPGVHSLPIAHAGGNIGYLPRPFAYRLNLYEAQAYEWYGTAGAVAEGTEEAVRKIAVREARKLTAAK
jgi:hypothetical protein